MPEKCSADAPMPCRRYGLPRHAARPGAGASPEPLIAIADAEPGIEYLHRAELARPLEEYAVRIRYIAHASFLIRTGGA